MNFETMGLALQRWTERFLTWRRRVKERRLERQKKKHVVLDWIEAFLWAVVVILFVNQYFIQAYRIPSESMVSTLNEGDMLFVNKMIFGPELLPGIIKLPGYAQPKRADIVVFENPQYTSPGPVIEVFQRFVYMLTLSLVDLDRDSAGNPRVHYLIKRAVGAPGDQVRFRDGNAEFLLPGESDWLTEAELKKRLGLSYQTRRLFPEADYPLFRTAGEASAYVDAGLADLAPRVEGRPSGNYSDRNEIEKSRLMAAYRLDPANRRYGAAWRRLELGQHVPDNRFLPLGDNRDNSKDGRAFGTVRFDKALGQPLLRYWPLFKAGPLE